MELKLYNTLTKQKDLFKSLEPGKVKMYTCGPTVYDNAHIGNLRAYLTADILRRVLISNGNNVNHISNITDVDDKTIKKSREENKTLANFTQEYTRNYFEDISTLNILKPTESPRATDLENIRVMIAMIEKLIEGKVAYSADDGVYFRVKYSADYGKLAGGISIGASRIVNDEYDKENASDFALWKFHALADGDVGWDASFGKGRPGWHIECSAMIHRLLGEPIDVHTGGIDLVFPHNTNEIAQTEAAFGKQIANFWVHNEFMTMEGQKMSKSLGNIITLREIKEKGFVPMALRYLTLMTHYRQKQNFTWEALDAAQTALDRLIEITKVRPSGPEGLTFVTIKWRERFFDAINDDLNTPQALAVVWELVRDTSLSPNDKQVLIFEFDKVLGLDLQKQAQQRQKEISEIPEEVKKIIAERESAREAKDFKKADELRKKIQELGYLLEDTDTGTKIKKG